MKNQFVLLLALLAFSVNAFTQEEENSSDWFEQGIIYLANNRPHQASEIFKELYERDSSNLNWAYLYGQSLARSEKELEKAIYLLNKAVKAYSPDYRKRDPNERRVSEYVYYYLLMAYSVYGECDKTIQTLNTFYMTYSYENEWFLVDAQRLHRECVQRDIPVVEKEIEVVEAEEDKPKRKHLVGTKSVQYTDKTAAFGIQVGAFFQPVFTYSFKGLRNVEAYVDQNGVYRYVIGRFVFKKQAEKLLQIIKDAGYPDAFITNVKDLTRFGEEVITIDYESVHKQLVGKVDFRIQIGVFKEDTIPANMMTLFLQLDSINYNQIGDLTILTVGSFSTYEQAAFYKELVQDVGVKDAFVTAWNYNRKVDLKQAIIFIEEQNALKAEREMEMRETEKKPKKKK